MNQDTPEHGVGYYSRRAQQEAAAAAACSCPDARDRHLRLAEMLSAEAARLGDSAAASRDRASVSVRRPGLIRLPG